VAAPLRQVLRRRRSTRVLLGEVTGFDLEQRLVTVEHLPNGEERRLLPYDVLVIAGGSGYSYFGHEEWEPFAPQLKTLNGALDLRARILSAFEAAEAEPDANARRAFLTFVVVGAGPTGVEMAGQIAELGSHALRNEFRSIDTSAVTVLLVEAAQAVLPTYTPRLSRSAERQLRSLGVTPRLETTVVDLGEGFVDVEPRGGERTRIETRTVVWAAGVRASSLAAALAEAAGLATDRGGRIEVEPDLTLPGHPEVFALGDMVSVRGADPLPGVAPVAMQQGRYVAAAIRGRLRGREAKPFHYRDKGNLATIGRAAAVADVKGLRLSGFIAWVTWLVVHLWYLVGFQNRLIVLVRWSFSFLTHGRAARLITAARLSPMEEEP